MRVRYLPGNLPVMRRTRSCLIGGHSTQRDSRRAVEWLQFLSICTPPAGDRGSDLVRLTEDRRHTEGGAQDRQFTGSSSKPAENEEALLSTSAAARLWMGGETVSLPGVTSSRPSGGARAPGVYLISSSSPACSMQRIEQIAAYGTVALAKALGETESPTFSPRRWRRKS